MKNTSFCQHLYIYKRDIHKLQCKQHGPSNYYQANYMTFVMWSSYIACPLDSAAAELSLFAHYIDGHYRTFYSALSPIQLSVGKLTGQQQVVG